MAVAARAVCAIHPYVIVASRGTTLRREANQMTARRLLAVGALVAGLSVGGYFAVQSVVQDGGSGSDVEQSDADPRAGLLDSDERTSLSVCVDSAGGYVLSKQDFQEIARMLEGELSTRADLPPEYAVHDVSQGCPAPFTSLGTPEPFPGMFAPSPDKPNDHRLFVYVVPPEVYSATFRAEEYTVAPEEFACEGDTCWTVTFGLYVPSSATEETLCAGLQDGLNLAPRSCAGG